MKEVAPEVASMGTGSGPSVRGMKLYLLPTLIALACGPAMVEPVAPERMDPGPAQVAAAAHVTECSGVQVRVGDVRWWVAQALVGHPDALGAWNPPGDVYLLPSAVDSEVISGHELLHHVLSGDPRHQDPRWERCGLWPAPALVPPHADG